MKNVPGLKGLPARLKWVRESHLGMRSPREMANGMARYYGRGVPRKSLSHVTIWRYEEGQRTPTAVELFAIAEFAEVNPGWLLTGDGPLVPGAANDYSAGAREAALEMWKTAADIWSRHGGRTTGDAGEKESRTVASPGQPSADAVEEAVGQLPPPPRPARRKKARGA